MLYSYVFSQSYWCIYDNKILGIIQQNLFYSVILNITVKKKKLPTEYWIPFKKISVTTDIKYGTYLML